MLSGGICNILLLNDPSFIRTTSSIDNEATDFALGETIVESRHAVASTNPDYMVGCDSACLPAQLLFMPFLTTMQDWCIYVYNTVQYLLVIILHSRSGSVLTCWAVAFHGRYGTESTCLGHKR